MQMCHGHQSKPPEGTTAREVPVVDCGLWGAADGGGGCACEGWAYRKSLYHPLTLTVTPKLLWKNEVFTNKKIISHFPKDNGQHLNYTNSLHANQDETTKVPTDSF